MRLIIDIDEYDYSTIVNDERYMPLDISVAIKNGTPIPDNDVIKTFYPDAKYDTYFDFVAMTNRTERTVFESHFDRDWWNAPYQKGGKE